MDKTSYDILIAKLNHANNMNKLIVGMLSEIMAKSGMGVDSNLTAFEQYTDLHNKNIERILKDRYDGS